MSGDEDVLWAPGVAGDVGKVHVAVARLVRASGGMGRDPQGLPRFEMGSSMLSLVPFLVCLAAPSVVQDLQTCESTCHSGTIEYIGDDGSRHKPRNGSVTVWRRWGLRWHTHTGEILDGGVFIEMPACNAGVDIGRIVLDGQEAYVLDEHWPRIQWTARFPASVHLRVVDAKSNTDLLDFEVREDERLVAPLDARDGLVVAAHASRRVKLPAWSVDPDPYFLCGAGWRNRCSGREGSNPRRFWVRAPGYAWATVVGEFERGGDLTARLVPEARLRVSLSEASRQRIGACDPLLEVRIGSQCRWKRLMKPHAALEFDGLPAGEITLRWRADDGQPGEKALVAERKVILLAGQSLVVDF